jgi:hypothetical protein
MAQGTVKWFNGEKASASSRWMAAALTCSSTTAQSSRPVTVRSMKASAWSSPPGPEGSSGGQGTRHLTRAPGAEAPGAEAPPNGGASSARDKLRPAIAKRCLQAWPTAGMTRS